MEDRIKLSYFYGREADQYSFYKIPKLLFTEEYFKKVSVEAKVLYGLMLDRMSLSMKNQWFDTEGRAYIYYSLEDIMDAMGCSNKKAISIMKELDIESGIGLIEKKRQGQGKPTMIYLKQFMIQDAQKCNNYISGEKSAISEVKNLHVLKCKNVISRSEEITLLEVKNIHTNKNNINNTELSNTESYLIVSGNDEIGSDVQAYAELIRDNIDLDILLERYTQMFNLLCEKADDVYGGRLPVHVRCLIDEAANIGQIPNLEKLVATIRSREISACLVLQAKSQLKAIYKDNADTIIGNMDSQIFLGGTEQTTLKDLNAILGKETIDMYNTGQSKGSQESYNMNYQKLGKDLMTMDELAVMDGSKCIVQVRGVRPFLSDKYDLTQHPNYKLTADYDKRNYFDIVKFLSHNLILKADDEYQVIDVTE